jgi:CO/xanthine dehydrogenase Mo-binding subunit
MDSSTASSCADGPEIGPTNAEIFASIPFLPSSERRAIQFNANKTVTLILPIGDYGRGWFTPYFANLAARRLGIPVRQLRVCYNAPHPAMAQMPAFLSASAMLRGETSPFASAVGDVIEALCDQVIEKSRLMFAAMINVGHNDIGYDHATGRLFVLEMSRSRTIIEIATLTGRSNDQPRSEAPNLRFPDPSAFAPGHCNE